MLHRALTAGATVIPRCPVQAIERDGAGFTVVTPKGRIAARDVIVATNGYTSRVTPDLLRRVTPISAHIFATEPPPCPPPDRPAPYPRVEPQHHPHPLAFLPSP